MTRRLLLVFVGMAAMAIGPLRRVVAARMPAPGAGPSKQVREAGYWDVRLLAEHPSDPSNNLRARLTGIQRGEVEDTRGWVMTLES